MIDFRAPTYDDKEHDGCGNSTIAVIEINGVTVPLCEECKDTLMERIKKYNETVFCYQCKFFVMSQYGWNYGGSCILKARKDGKTITKKEAGYSYCEDCMNACNNAKLKS